MSQRSHRAFSLSEFPSDLPCSTSIAFQPRDRNDSKLNKYSESSPNSAVRLEAFSAIEYSYKPASVENLSDTESVLPEDENDNCGTIIHTPHRNLATVKLIRNESVLGFDPLSSFTVYPADRPQHHEPSFIEQRANPSSLRYAHGSLALQNDKIVQAITDAAGHEVDWDRLKHLNLSGKGLTTLHNLDKYCPSLRILNVDNNDIEHLSGVPSSVRMLYVNDNRLSELTSFDHLPNLQLLHADRNKLENLDALCYLDHLQEIKASHNKLKDISGVSQLLGLRNLEVGHNLIENTKWSEWSLRCLTNLDLSYNHLWFADVLTALPRLQNLNLEGNQINDFNARCDERHQALQTLNLKNNSLMHIDLRWLPKIRELDLDGNLIMSAKSLANLYMPPSLVKLSLREQQVSKQGRENVLVNTILNTDFNCQELYLSANPVTEGCLTMPQFSHYSIRVLELAGCGLQQLPKHFGQYFPGCRYLNLSFNGIKVFDDLRGLESLEELHIVQNRMGSIRRTTQVLTHLRCLRILDLRLNGVVSGWYIDKPGSCQQSGPPPLEDRPWDLPGRPQDKYRGLADHKTVCEKKLTELMLAQYCPHLVKLDGASWDRDYHKYDKKGKKALAELGYLVKNPNFRGATQDCTQ
jgi:protein NUD1